MLLWLYFGVLGLITIRTVSFAIYLFRNKKRGAIPLFILSFFVILSPIITATVNKLI